MVRTLLRSFWWLAAVVTRRRDLASTRQFWLMMGTAGALALGYTGFIVAIWREYR